jgi:hypothetical protein
MTKVRVAKKSTPKKRITVTVATSRHKVVKRKVTRLTPIKRKTKPPVDESGKLGSVETLQVSPVQAQVIPAPSAQNAPAVTSPEEIKVDGVVQAEMPVESGAVTSLPATTNEPAVATEVATPTEGQTVADAETSATDQQDAVAPEKSIEPEATLFVITPPVTPKPADEVTKGEPAEQLDEVVQVDATVSAATETTQLSPQESSSVEVQAQLQSLALDVHEEVTVSAHVGHGSNGAEYLEPPLILIQPVATNVGVYSLFQTVWDSLKADPQLKKEGSYNKFMETIGSIEASVAAYLKKHNRRRFSPDFIGDEISRLKDYAQKHHVVPPISEAVAGDDEWMTRTSEDTALTHRSASNDGSQTAVESNSPVQAEAQGSAPAEQTMGQGTPEVKIPHFAHDVGKPSTSVGVPPKPTVRLNLENKGDLTQRRVHVPRKEFKESELKTHPVDAPAPMQGDKKNETQVIRLPPPWLALPTATEPARESSHTESTPGPESPVVSPKPDWPSEYRLPQVKWWEDPRVVVAAACTIIAVIGLFVLATMLLPRPQAKQPPMVQMDPAIAVDLARSADEIKELNRTVDELRIIVNNLRFVQLTTSGMTGGSNILSTGQSK